MDNKRIEKLTGLLQRLNGEGITEDLRKEAMDIVANIDPIELSIAEQKLIQNGMNPHELRNLCEIHMEVLKDELDKVKTRIEPGHVLDTLIEEHEKIKGFLNELDEMNSILQKLESLDKNKEILEKLLKIANNILDAENHHRREEDVLFPELERRNITGPTRIMRMEHDDLRARKKLLKETIEKAEDMGFAEFKSVIDETSKYIVFNLRDHIYKENYILYPTALDAIKEKEKWESMKVECDKVGYCGFTPEIKNRGGNKMSKFAAQVDARIYPPRDKHAKIFETFENLKKGEVMELINDHDPRPLHYQMLAEYTDMFEWKYLEQGPEVWRVAIEKK